jgi:maleate isomerase
MYGWRARIGIIYPCSGMRDSDFFRLAPPGVSVHVTRLSFNSQATAEAIRRMSAMERLVEAALLLAQLQPSCITWADTSGSFLFGAEGDLEQIVEIQRQTGVPASTTTTACLEAFRVLGATRIAVASPYIGEINAAMTNFLEARGVIVTRLETLNLGASYEIARVSAEKIHSLARAAWTSESDALFIPCTDFLDIDIIRHIEHDLSRPVVTANQATMWHALRLSGVKERVEGFGTLMSRV